MRRLTELPPDRAARLAAALAARGLPAVAQVGPGDAAEVWVRDEDHLPAAREELAAFLADPDAPRFAAAEKALAEARKQEKRQKARRGRTVRGREVFDRPLWKRAPACVALAAAAVLTGLLGWDPQADSWILWSKPEPLLKWLYLVPVFPGPAGWTWDQTAELAPTFTTGQLWRLVTPIFIHRDPIHLRFNLSWLLTLGGAVEARWGTGRLLGLVLVSAVVSNVAEYYLDLQLYAPVLGLFDVGAGNPMGGGLSGVVYALFGLVWGRQKGGDPGVGFPPNTIFLMVGWLLLCVTGTLGAVGNVAHATGLLLGLAVGYGTARREYKIRPR